MRCRLLQVVAAWLCGLVLLAGCGNGPLRNALSRNGGAGQPTVMPTPASPESGTGETSWQLAAPGVEWRRVRASDGGGPSDSLLVVRGDPARLRLRVAYDVAAPGTIGEWAQAHNPLLVVNGGYFDQQGRATALVINDGTTHGSSYQGFGGMFAVAADGTLDIRSLRDHPYDASENLAQALQSTPMLLLSGGSLAAIDDNGDRARRTVVALDRQGRLVFIVSPRPFFTLSGLARWLRDSDLQLQTALNLDGGSSTGIYLKTSDKPLLSDSLVRVPLVIIAERR